MSFEGPTTIRTGDRGPGIIAVAVVGITVSTIAVVLRFWARAVTAKLSFWWDDWLILATLVFSHTFLALGIAWIRFGLGKHIEAISMDNVLPGNYMAHAATLVYAVDIWLIKLSALCLFARIFRQSPTFRRVLWGFGFAVTGWFVCTAIIPWFNCTPVRKTIEPFIPGTCFDRMGWFLASAFINAFWDFAILVLPMPVIWRLQMTLRKKISVTFVFVLGYCSAFLSFARFIIIIRDPTVMSVEPAADPYWHTVPLLWISYLEAPIAILALCAPAIGQLAARAKEHHAFTSFFSIFSSSRRSRKSGGSGSAENETKAGYYHHNSSGGPTTGGQVSPQNPHGHHYWPPVAHQGGRCSTTAFVNHRESAESQNSTTPVIPMGSIGVSRGVEITHHQSRSMV
ncbi:hypothetical protein SLS64_006342 [Diaporthe eres]|uniref:Rhodopsin domain-containing protein n=1 Tax=Diaporthe eres TaxID=83184 RepID=A0ABR1NXB3_DIAER